MKPYRKKLPSNITSPFRAVTRRQKRGLVPKSGSERKGSKTEPRRIINDY